MDKYDEMWSDPAFCAAMDRLDRVLPETPSDGIGPAEWRLARNVFLTRIPDLFHSPLDVHQSPHFDVIHVAPDAPLYVEDQIVFDLCRGPLFKISEIDHRSTFFRTVERDDKQDTDCAEQSSPMLGDDDNSDAEMQYCVEKADHEAVTMDTDAYEIESDKEVKEEDYDESDMLFFESEGSDVSTDYTPSASSTTTEEIVSFVLNPPAAPFSDTFMCGVHGCTDTVSRTNKDVKIHFRDTPQHYGRVPTMTKLPCPFAGCSMSGETADRNRLAEHLCSDEHFKAYQICYACDTTFKSGRLYSMTRHRDGEPRKHKFGSCKVCEGCKRDDFPSGEARTKHESHCLAAKVTKAGRLKREKAEKKEDRLNRIIMCGYGSSREPTRAKARAGSGSRVSPKKERI